MRMQAGAWQGLHTLRAQTERTAPRTAQVTTCTVAGTDQGYAQQGHGGKGQRARGPKGRREAASGKARAPEARGPRGLEGRGPRGVATDGTILGFDDRLRRGAWHGPAPIDGRWLGPIWTYPDPQQDLDLESQLPAASCLCQVSSAHRWPLVGIAGTGVISSPSH